MKLTLFTSFPTEVEKRSCLEKASFHAYLLQRSELGLDGDSGELLLRPSLMCICTSKSIPNGIVLVPDVALIGYCMSTGIC